MYLSNSFDFIQWFQYLQYIANAYKAFFCMVLQKGGQHFK